MEEDGKLKPAARPLPAAALVFAFVVCAQAQGPVFKATTNLQSIPIQATDRQGNPVSGLTASDFTLLEDGRPQKIAFFAAEHQPVSLAILMDASRGMDFGGKLDRARAAMAPLLRGSHVDDEIFFMPFTDEAGPFERLSAEQRLQPPAIPKLGHRGSALYDALASALCHMRGATNMRQAVVVITDGVDQHSRLKLEQLTGLVRSSRPQVFMIGLYSKPEYEVYRRREKTVTLVGMREIDNPVIVFDRLAKESGAEAFFPASERDLKRALDRISALLESQYTLAYYPRDAGKVRKIDVKVKTGGVRVSTRHTLGPESPTEGVRFSATGCTVSPQDHPYPWESHVTSNATSPMVYHEDFSDARSGWPNRNAGDDARRFHARIRSRYAPGGYELSRWLSLADGPPAAVDGVIASAQDTVITAYGPWWQNFRASALLEGRWSGEPGEGGDSAVGMVFDVMEKGYYAFRLTSGSRNATVAELVKGNWSGRSPEVLWKTALASREKTHKLSVECDRGRIRLFIDGQNVGETRDRTFEYGLVGFGVFGQGRAIVHDLLVDGLR